MLDTAGTKSEKQKKRISLGFLLATTFGLLIAVSIAIVLSFSVASNFRNTFSLLNTQAEFMLEGMERSIIDEAAQAERAVETLARLYAESAFEIGDLDSQKTILDSLLLSQPVVEGLLIFDLEGNRTGIQKTATGQINYVDPISTEDQKALDTLGIGPFRESNRAIWGEPVKRNGITFQNVTYSLVRDGEIRGVAAAVVGGKIINRVISQIAAESGSTVYLLDAQNNVLAHSRLPLSFQNNPTIPIGTFPDANLRLLLEAKPSEEFSAAREKGISVFETPGFDGLVFLLKEIKNVGQDGISIGTYLPKADVGQEVKRVAITGMIGIALLLLAVLIAVLLGRRLAKLMLGVSHAADRISAFDLENIPQLPSSHVREIDVQAKALNSASTALKAFSRYVPRSLVKRLITSGEEANRSVEREVTVMFTDIVGFTAMTEQMDAVSAAQILNDHFDEVCSIIEANQGTVDKFMGDCIMAFWGAPDADENHAQNALNAARQIRLAMAKVSNAPSPDETPEKLKMRIGIHTGRVIVGNIGSQSRSNYTIVGDVVNVAHRLEQLGKQLPADGNVVTCISQDTAERGGANEDFSAVGTFTLRGRQKPVSVLAQGVELEKLAPEAAGTVIKFPA